MSTGEFCPKCRKYYGDERWHCNCATMAINKISSIATDTTCQTCGANKSRNGGIDGGFTSYNISSSPAEDGIFDVLNCNRCKEPQPTQKQKTPEEMALEGAWLDFKIKESDSFRDGGYFTSKEIFAAGYAAGRASQDARIKQLEDESFDRLKALKELGE